MLSWILLICLAITTAHAQDWNVTGDLNTGRGYHAASLLPNGNMLVAGGFGTGSVLLNTAEVYNTATGVWTMTGSLTYARNGHTATLLLNGNVLVAAGADGSTYLNSAELYNSTTGVWTVTGNLTYARFGHTATLLANGNVLVTGGYNNGGEDLYSAELYNTATGLWTMTGNLTYSRDGHTATLLANGNVLVAAGENVNGNLLNSAELYDATTGVWTVTGNLTTARYDHTATLLTNGDVLVACGTIGGALNSAELYSATTGVWTLTGSLTYAREYHTATLLTNGDVLVAGGYNHNNGFLNTAELYPDLIAPTPTLTPTTTPAPTTPASTTAPTNTPTSSTATTTPTPVTTTPAPTTRTVPTSNPKPTPASSSTGSTESTPTPSLSAVVASSSNVGAIIGGIVGGLVGLVLLVLLLWLLRSRYWNKKDVNSSDYTIPIASSKLERSLSQLSDVNRSEDVKLSRSDTGTSLILSNRQSDDIYISFNSLKLGAVLGQGHFGQVYQADYTGAQVAVKKSKGIDEKLILEEATMMKNIPPHPNVLQYYGVSEENGEFMMVTELCDKGNLAQYLRNLKNNLTPQQSRQFCRQIASGMWHVSKYGIIHRDLRAENILLSSTDTKLVAKVADFGLARSLNRHDPNDSGYYRMTELKPIPFAWTPPEVLNQSDQLKYVATSDVWSFGIVMWEIYSRGAKPFDKIDVNVVISIIREQHRTTPLLSRPDNCPDDVFTIMNSCWAFNPQDRPTFEQLYNQLS